MKRKKAADFLKVVAEAFKRPDSLEAIKTQLVTAASDDQMAEAMLDEGLKQVSRAPGTLSKSTYYVLFLIAFPREGDEPTRAITAGPNSQNMTRRLEKLLVIQRSYAEHNPSPIILDEIRDTYRLMGKYADAATTFEQSLARYPDTKSAAAFGSPRRSSSPGRTP